MGDRPTSMEERVRGLLDQMAGDAPGSDGPRPAVLRRARRRMAWTGTAAAVGVVLAVTSVGIAVPRLLRDTEPAAPPGIVSPSPTPAILRHGPVPRVPFVLRGRVYVFESRDRWEHIGSVPYASMAAPPVETPSGVLVLAKDSPHFALYLVRPDREPLLLADDVDGQGFTVSAGGEEVAYARQATSPSSMAIRMIRVANGSVVAESPPIPGHAVPEGFLGNALMVGSWDGAVRRVHWWNPATAELKEILGPFQQVGASWPAGRRAFLGKLGCFHFAEVTQYGAVIPVGPTEPCAPTVGTFSPDGSGLAGIESRGWETFLSVYKFGDPSPRVRIDIPRALQAVWESPRDILVLSGTPRGSATEWTVTRCTIGDDHTLTCEIAYQASYSGVTRDQIAMAGPAPSAGP